MTCRRLLSKLEWLDVCMLVRPDLTRDEYEAMWQSFIYWKRHGAGS